MKRSQLCRLALLLLLVVPARADPATNAPAVASVDDQKARQSLVDDLAVAANPSVFAGDTFPSINYVEPDLVRRALGPYTVKVRYFDAGWREVARPGALGRYGALVTIQFPGGVSDTRHLTLYHITKDYSRAHDPCQGLIQFPKGFGLPADIGEAEQWNVDQYLDGDFDEARHRKDNFAVLVAGLHDIAKDPERFRGDEFWRVDSIWWDELEKRLGLEVPYQRLVRLPDDYDQDPGKKWPLILFLHGSGERGHDISILKKWGPAAYADQGHPLPFIVVTPQCLPRHRWNPDLLVQLLADVEKTCRVDDRRIYVTGLSMGGIGSLDLAAAYPHRFAAVACLSGRENPGNASRLRDEPIWLFHGDQDETVPTHESIELAAALKKQGDPVKLTLIPGEGHGGWDKTYADPALYAWFLAHRL